MAGTMDNTGKSVMLLLCNVFQGVLSVSRVNTIKIKETRTQEVVGN
jgi:hypothetical protein